MNRGWIVAWEATGGRWLRPRRLLTAPRVRMLRIEGNRATVAVDGLVCSACAMRTRSALCAVPGVEDATVDLETGRAEVSLREGYEDLDAGTLQRAVDRVVIAR